MSGTANDKKRQVIIVDPDPMIIDLLRYNLENEGYSVAAFTDADSALTADYSITGLVITEALLGEINGLMYAASLKSNPSTSAIPVIICSTLDSEDDIVKGFDAGADDYILKPFSLRELMARIRAVMRRRGMSATLPAEQESGAHLRPVSFRGLVVSPADRSVSADGSVLSLTRNEMMLLYLLMCRPDHVYSHSELYEAVWRKAYDGSSRALDVSISRLRKKLCDYAANIVNRTGLGYAFITEARG